MHHQILSLVVGGLFWRPVNAFPGGAGSCPTGTSAALGHVAPDPVPSFADLGYELLVDGQVVDVTTELSAGERYEFAVRATANPFRGALIRVDGLGLLEPGSNSALATACTVAEGVGHTDNSDKTYFSAFYDVMGVESVVLDVTVVESNTNGISVYSYEQFTFAVMENNADMELAAPTIDIVIDTPAPTEAAAETNAPTPVPTEVATTSAPTPTPIQFPFNPINFPIAITVDPPATSAPTPTPIQFPFNPINFPTTVTVEPPVASPTVTIFLPPVAPQMESNAGFPGVEAPTFLINFVNNLPSDMPSDVPSEMPSDMPSQMPSDMPSQMPSDVPSEAPTGTGGGRPLWIFWNDPNANEEPADGNLRRKTV